MLWVSGGGVSYQYSAISGQPKRKAKEERVVEKESFVGWVFAIYYLSFFNSSVGKRLYETTKDW